MEPWFDAGALSQDEFDHLMKLVARYVAWDVDQFDHWAMPAPAGSIMYVDFNQADQAAYPVDAYRMMWPDLPASSVGWTLWRQDDDGNRVVVQRYGNEHAARMRAEALEARGHKQRYWVEPPEPSADGN